MLVPLVGKATSNKTIANANMTSAIWVAGESCLNSSSQWFRSISFFFPLFSLYYGKLPGTVRLPGRLRNHHVRHCNAYEKDSCFWLRKGRACRADNGDLKKTGRVWHLTEKYVLDIVLVLAEWKAVTC